MRVHIREEDYSTSRGVWFEATHSLGQSRAGASFNGARGASPTFIRRSIGIQFSWLMFCLQVERGRGRGGCDRSEPLGSRGRMVGQTFSI